MDTHVLPEFLVLSLAGASLSIAAYSAFRDNKDDRKLLLIIACFFSFAFLVIFTLSFILLENMFSFPHILGLFFYILIFMAFLSIIRFIFHRLRVDQRMRDEELNSALDIIRSSNDSLDDPISLFKPKNK